MNYFKFEELKEIPKAPWSKYYREGDMNLNIPSTSMYNYLENKMLNFIKSYCFDYYGHKIKYSEFLKMIDNCAKGIYKAGVRNGDIVTVCVPTTLEGVISFLATNKLGAIVNFIHPSSSENEIKASLNETKSKVLVLLDVNYIKIKNTIKDTNVHKVVLVDLCGYMPLIAKIRHSVKYKMKIKFSKEDSLYVWWDEFISRAEKYQLSEYAYNGDKNDPAMILHSGGTTGTPKGIVLSNSNLIAYVEALKTSQDYLECGDTILALMPIFHGFGIMYSIILPLSIGMFIVLRPKFNAKDYCKMIIKYKPQVLPGVPSLIESLLREWPKPKANLNFLKCILIGGDLLKPNLKERIDDFLRQHGADVGITQGYGLSEAVCGVTLGIRDVERKGTVGIPSPGIYIGIFSKEDEEVPYGNEGEICVCGPTVMLGYYNNIEETNMALHIHRDGNVWLHTGDLGSMDEDGFVTYTNRLKRMIVSSGYNVYPNQIEKLFENHPSVRSCAVVGIAHKYKMEVPKAFIVLNEGFEKNEQLIMELKKICIQNLPKYSWPYEYEFLEKLPTTRAGKVDFRKLQNITKRND